MDSKHTKKDDISKFIQTNGNICQMATFGVGGMRANAAQYIYNRGLNIDAVKNAYRAANPDSKLY